MISYSADFMPQQVHPKLELAKQVGRTTTQLCLQVANSAEASRRPDGDVDYVVMIPTSTPRFPVRIGAADSLKPVDFIRYPEDRLPVMAFNLYSERSPYITEIDLDAFGPDATIHQLLCLPELPPFVVNEQRVELHNEGTSLERIHKYLSEVDENMQPAPYFLSDDEAMRLTQLLTQQDLGTFIDLEEVWSRGL